MDKQHYSWWNYIKEIVRRYPERADGASSGVRYREREAVLASIISTKRMKNGEERLEVIKLMHWDKTHTLEGAALSIPCDRATAARWQRSFFEEVARNRGLLD